MQSEGRLSSMSISINNNPYIQNYTTVAKSGKPTDVFALPNEQDLSTAGDSDSTASNRITEIDYEEVQEFLRTKAKALPDGFGMTGEEAEEYLKNMGAPILYEFNEDGSTSIKEGLSHAQWLLAKKNLAKMQPFKPGLGYERYWLDLKW